MAIDKIHILGISVQIWVHFPYNRNPQKLPKIIDKSEINYVIFFLLIFTNHLHEQYLNLFHLKLLLYNIVFLTKMMNKKSHKQNRIKFDPTELDI